jgi:hypothetical protein
MQQQPLDYAAQKNRAASPARRIRIWLIVGAVLCLAAFVASSAIIVVYVGGG